MKNSTKPIVTQAAAVYLHRPFVAIVITAAMMKHVAAVLRANISTEATRRVTVLSPAHRVS
jgi:hypothetical protein